MKRTIISIAASLLAVMPYGVFAQESNADRSDDFHGHWFIQAQGGIGATVGETKFGDLISPMATVSFGYQFTPVWSLRAGIGGWQGKGALVGPTQVYKYNFLQGNVDVMVDLCSIFSGYRVQRVIQQRRGTASSGIVSVRQPVVGREQGLPCGPFRSRHGNPDQ